MHKQVEIQTHPTKGRYVTTNNDAEILLSDRRVLVEDPVAAISLIACNSCFTNDRPLRACTQCKLLRYCSRQCQKKDWETHREECKRIQAIQPYKATRTLLLAARIIRLSKDVREKLVDPAVSHMEEQNMIKQMQMAKCVQALAGTSDEDADVMYELQILDKIRYNALTIVNSTLEPVGIGFYSQASKFNHSCEANCFAMFEGGKLHMRYIGTSPLLPNTELTISYINPAVSKKQRQQKLQEGYNFLCDCDRCENENDLPRLPLNQLDELHAARSLYDQIILLEREKDFEGALVKLRQAWAKIKDLNPSCRDVLETQYEIAYEMSCTGGDLQNYDLAHEYLEIAMDCHRTLFPKNRMSPQFAVNIYRMVKYSMALNKREAALQLLASTFPYLVKCLGDSARVTEEARECMYSLRTGKGSFH